MNARRHETGMSSVLMVLVVVIVTCTVAVMIESSVRGQEETGRQSDKALTTSGADTAISRYQAALNAGLVNQQTRYQLRRSAYTAFATKHDAVKIVLHPATPGLALNVGKASESVNPSPSLVRRGNYDAAGGQAVDKASGETDADAWGFDDYYLEQAGGAEASSQFTVEEIPNDGGPSLYWQVYRVDPLILAPESANTRNTRNVDVVFRTWKAGVDPRYIKASFAAGRFGDYQLLSDEQIDFKKSDMSLIEFQEWYKSGQAPTATAAVSVTGKVHSNGVGDTTGGAITGGPVTCDAAAKLSATVGGVSLPTSPSCANNVQAEGKPVSLGGVRDVMAAVDTECAQGARFAKCFTGAYDYTVRITSTQAVVSRYGSSAPEATIDLTGRPIGLKFPSDVWVYQPQDAVPASRLTILAESKTTVANIHIVTAANAGAPGGLGDFGSFGPRRDVNAVPTGLIAQGDVIVEANNDVSKTWADVNPAWPTENCGNNASGPSTIVRAAIISETGTLTIPPKWRSQIKQAATPRCQQFTLYGSLTTRTTPVLSIRWADPENDLNVEDSYGYRARSYEWDPVLGTTTPPYFPQTGSWGLSSWSEWNKDCVAKPAPEVAAGC